MTREEAIKIIEVVFQSKEAYKYYDSVTHQALDMAIEALKREDTMLKEIERVVLYGERSEE